MGRHAFSDAWAAATAEAAAESGGAVRTLATPITVQHHASGPLAGRAMLDAAAVTAHLEARGFFVVSAAFDFDALKVHTYVSPVPCLVPHALWHGLRCVY